MVWSGEQQRRMFQAKEQQAQMQEAQLGLGCTGWRRRGREAPSFQHVPWVLRPDCDLLIEKGVSSHPQEDGGGGGAWCHVPHALPAQTHQHSAQVGADWSPSLCW